MWRNPKRFVRGKEVKSKLFRRSFGDSGDHRASGRIASCPLSVRLMHRIGWTTVPNPKFAKDKNCRNCPTFFPRALAAATARAWARCARSLRAGSSASAQLWSDAIFRMCRRRESSEAMFSKRPALNFALSERNNFGGCSSCSWVLLNVTKRSLRRLAAARRSLSDWQNTADSCDA